MRKEKTRIDNFLVKHGFCESIERAHSLLLSGSVLCNDTPITKPGHLISETDKVRLRERIKKYVSRGALKLLGAFEDFPKAQVTNLVCWDWGASTGGFTEILIEKEAKLIYAIDVGYGQMAHRIANHSKVFVLDKTPIKKLDWTLLPDTTQPIFVSMDISFQSCISAFLQLKRLATQKADQEFFGLTLFKPQFEVSSEDLHKGIVKDSLLLGRCLRKAIRQIKKNDSRFSLLGISESRIKGTEGNREFFLFWKRRNSL